MRDFIYEGLDDVNHIGICTNCGTIAPMDYDDGFCPSCGEGLQGADKCWCGEYKDADEPVCDVCKNDLNSDFLEFVGTHFEGRFTIEEMIDLIDEVTR